MKTAFYRPLVGSFAITATLLFVAAPVRAESPAATPDCAASAPRHHGLRLGGLLSTVGKVGMMGGLGPVGMLAGRGGALVNVATSVAASAAAGNAARDAADQAAAVATCAAQTAAAEQGGR